MEAAGPMIDSANGVSSNWGEEGLQEADEQRPEQETPSSRYGTSQDGQPPLWVRRWVETSSSIAPGKIQVLKWVKYDPQDDVSQGTPAQTEAPLTSPTSGQKRRRRETPNQEIVCPYEGCGKVFPDMGAIRKHARIHGEKAYQCTFEGCGKRFVDSSKLKRHFLIHTGEKSWICPYEGCRKAFSLPYNLRSHVRSTHDPEFT
ncbi:hypothetical protein KFL_001920070 [Klebsormidium nitens]|uniref:C2H2-type domain-containing protein n=1 Tax=Klebsormidium nitens TaxID=105231 RepID=A0A1Y1I6Z9_KLENI|nr:hypothetical protein KFL_001920070 [Klebsormidium nitens]|eukprot:GAQ84506.1 hypothetical protein KFL_001920070 [Klebsormidium nitens]